MSKTDRYENSSTLPPCRLPSIQACYVSFSYLSHFFKDRLPSTSCVLLTMHVFGNCTAKLILRL